MNALKTSKITAKILKGSLIVTPNKEACIFTAEIVDSRKVVSEEIYSVRCETPTEGYTVRKMDVDGVKETYSVNLWDTTCECGGFKNGYLCRHLRMVSALVKSKKIK